MPAVGYQYNFLLGLSDFWQRFFADANQLESLYHGSAILIGQAYLDLMSATLGVALRDAVALDREYYHMLAIREDEVRFVEGVTVNGDRWAYDLPDPVVAFISIDNRVIEPTASLEEQRDYDVFDRVVYFKIDPTNPTNNGLPLAGYARRSLDVAVGGSFTDTTVVAWTTATTVKKGDTLRILDVGTDGAQRLREDHEIVLVRDPALFVSEDSSLSAPATNINFVVLRVPANPVVNAEPFTLVAGVPYNNAALIHNRLDHESVRVFAKRLSDGQDVVEDVDYTINYEGGLIYQLTAWQGVGPYAIDYTWRKEVYPSAGPEPRYSATGKIIAAATTVRVLQMAAWTPETLVDRRTLANNFGALIGRESDSTESYRAFLEGIFQLYILGPVLERIESALNVVLNLPVVRDDGEIYITTDITDSLVDRILTTRPSTNQTATYEFPKGTPFRADLVPGLVLESFEPFTIAVAVTDYVQTPSWWYGETIPEKLFSPVGGVVPPIFRRIASPYYVENIVGAADDPQVGDPGLHVGSDESGVPLVPTPARIYRHRMAFVLMDRYLKYHTFSVKFDALALSAAGGTAFAQSLKDLNELVLSAKPSHTYVFTTPTTSFRDEIQVEEDDISFARLVGSRIYGPDKVLFTDDPPVIGAGIWNVGDYFKYEFFTVLTVLPLAVPVTLANTPVLPRVGRLVRAYVAGDVAGVALVENVDYTVNYVTRQITRLTVWTTGTVNVTYTQLNIGNLSDAPIGVADMPLLVNGVDPAHITGAFSASAAGWDGVITPPTAPRDIGLVERALIVYAHP